MATASANGESSRSNDLVEQFCSITGATRERAESMLEICSNDLEMAMNMHWESEDVSGIPDVAEIPPSAAGPPVPILGGNNGEDGVRAPIPPTRGVLVEPPLPMSLVASNRIARARAARGVPSVFGGGLRDFEAETREQEERARRGLPLNSFEISSSKQKRLEDLFRPPIDLMFTGSFQGARDSGTRDNRWLLVNIQNNQEFKCQMLNRDVWSDKRIRVLIKENFVFWQAYIDSDDGERFSMFYPVKEWPYIAVLDPRTGENLVQWHETDANALYQNLNDFLGDHSNTPADASNGPPKKLRVVASAAAAHALAPADDAAADAEDRSVIDMSEDSQMEAAIKASLAESHVKEGSKPDSPDVDAASDLETYTDSEDASCSSFSSPFKRSVLHDGAGPSTSSGSSSAAAVPVAAVPVPIHAPSAAVVVPDASKRNLAAQLGAGSAQDENRWKKYVGDEKDPESKLLLRLPDGKKVHVCMPCSSQIQAVITYAECLGFPPSKFEIVTAFPRKNISEMPADSTLKDAGLHPQETVFVQAR